MSNRPFKYPKSRCTRTTVRGFTLIEVVISLAIAAIGLLAVTAAVSQMVDAANSMQRRTYASWIGQNKITEMRLANVLPEVSSTNGDIIYAGMEWTWRATISETGVEALFRVDVEVGIAASDTSDRTVTGFIGEPTPPGNSNIDWGGTPQDVGEDI